MIDFAAAKVDDNCVHKGCEERPKFLVVIETGTWRVCSLHVWEGVQRLLNRHRIGYQVIVERLP